ncbi:hypothetical protein [Aureimonas sp. AU40]|uniref:hypothetical protein n=1 Tax=Aureimonas sp. AU40 TaxID=1637747 RepID=UPI0012E35AB1|nr:hypothetical protein [Aureimonas sp. AU40]
MQRVRSFDEGLRKNLGIRIVCRGCGKEVIYRCYDFMGYIQGGAEIEDLRWRCTTCGKLSRYVRYAILDILPREALAQWKPRPGMVRRY